MDALLPQLAFDRRSVAARGFLLYDPAAAEGDVAWHFDQVARFVSSQTAIQTPRQRISYAELNELADEIARAILNRDPLATRPIALFLDQGPKLSAAILGVLRAGGFFVVLKPSHPSARTRFLLDDSQAQFLVTDGARWRAARELVESDAKVLNVDSAPRRAGRILPVSADAPDRPASLTYTSGSTGNPKGVVHTHRYLLHRALAGRRLGIGPGDRVASIGTSSSQFRSLLNGASSLPWNLKERGLSDLAGWLKSEGVTVLHAIPSVFREFAMTLGRRQSFPDLRLINLRGETLFRRDVELFQQLFGGDCLLVNEYGASETGTIAQFALDSATTFQGNIAPVGGVIQDKSVLLLDSEGRPAARGEVGEIAVQSRFLSPGYWRNAELTESKFRPDPSGGDERIYLTGDLGRFESNNVLVHVGRRDSQVKIRGQRIETGEVEGALRLVVGVRDAAVVALDDESGEKRLVGYVVAAVGARPPTVEELAGALRRQLPESMIPATFVLLDAMPMTPNGKIDRKALPAPGRSRPALATQLVAPRSATEESIAGIWCEVLTVDVVGIDDDFFDVGGDSLKAALVHSRMLETFGVDLSLSELFQARTVALQAESIDAALAGPSNSSPSRLIQPIPRLPRAAGATFPASFAQQRLWFLNQLSALSGSYNEILAWRLTGRVDVAALRDSLSDLVNRHEVLRTTLAERDGVVEQIIGEPGPMELAVIDWDDRTDLSRVERFLAERARRPFDLSSDRLLRADLVRLGDEEAVLAIVVHHIAFDGWSSRILARELAEAYNARTEGRSHVFSDLPVQYADFAAWQREMLRGELLESQVGYWREKLRGATGQIELNCDRPRTRSAAGEGARVSFRFPAELSRAVSALARDSSATLFMTLAAAFALVLSRFGAGSDVVLGTPIAGRTRRETENLVGLFVNTLPLRFDLSGHPTFRALLTHVCEEVVGAFSHSEVPFDRLVADFGSQRDLGPTPLVQVLFVLQNVPRSEFQLKGVEAERISIHNGGAKFDLVASLVDDPDGLRGRFTYRTDLFDPSTIERLVRAFERLLEAVAASPDAPLEQISLVSDDDARMLSEWNDTTRDYPQEVRIPDLFERQVERTPDAVALIDGSQCYSYRELNERANRLGHYLRDRGVGSDVLVALAVERSSDLIVAMLGVLKAGGAYLPLDLRSPPARLRRVLAATRAKWAICGRGSADLPDPSELTVLSFEHDRLPWADQSAENPTSCGLSRDLAYVMLTSGSTGEPKGVAVEHRSIARLVFGVDYAVLGPDRVFLQLASPAFDASTFEIWGALLHGGRLVLAPESLPDFGTLERLLCDHHVTTLWLTAGLFNSLMEQRPEALRGVQEILTGGEALSVRHVQEALRVLPPQVRLINGYGPTECTTFACCHTIERPLNDAAVSIPIGRPISNTRVYVLDGGGQPAPIGWAGELYLAGSGLARGYWNDSESTNERFVPDPFDAAPGARMYRTGDRARWNSNGTLEFLGRIDQQIKIRGFRIEPAEIESLLVERASVKQAVVVAHEGGSLGRRLIAYLVAASEVEIDLDAVRRELKLRLPDYMVPAVFMQLSHFPLGRNGKLDREALPAPDESQSPSPPIREQPRDDLEATLVAIWAEILDRKTIGVQQNFFDLGGHSLLALRLVARIEQVLGKKLPLDALLQQPTIEQQAEFLRGTVVGDLCELVPIQAGGSKPPLFVLHSASGYVMFWRAFVPYLAPDQPLIGVRPVKSPQLGLRYGDFETIAAHYAEMLIQFQPNGAFRLAGYSAGGAFAYETARQLEIKGRTVAFLGIIDHSPRGVRQSLESRLRLAPSYLANWFYWARDNNYRVSFLSLKRRISGLLTRFRAPDAASPATPILETERSYRIARLTYQPSPYPGPVTLFRALCQTPWRFRAFDYGWSVLCKSVQVVVFPHCEHHGIVREPTVQRVAAAMQTQLDAVNGSPNEQRSGPPSV